MNKAQSDKIGYGLTMIPYHSIIRIGKIFVEGLRYGRDNWKKGVGDKEYQEERLEHALRHIMLWKEGDRSEDHLAKVAWFCVTQLELERLEDAQKEDSTQTEAEALNRKKQEGDYRYVIIERGYPVAIEEGNDFQWGKDPITPEEGFVEIYNGTQYKVIDYSLHDFQTNYEKWKTYNSR